MLQLQFGDWKSAPRRARAVWAGSGRGRSVGGWVGGWVEGIGPPCHPGLRASVSEDQQWREVGRQSGPDGQFWGVLPPRHIPQHVISALWPTSAPQTPPPLHRPLGGHFSSRLSAAPEAVSTAMGRALCSEPSQRRSVFIPRPDLNCPIGIARRCGRGGGRQDCLPLDYFPPPAPGVPPLRPFERLSQRQVQGASAGAGLAHRCRLPGSWRSCASSQCPAPDGTSWGQRACEHLPQCSAGKGVCIVHRRRSRPRGWACRVFTSGGGGGGPIEPPKTGGGGSGKGLN